MEIKILLNNDNLFEQYRQIPDKVIRPEELQLGFEEAAAFKIVSQEDRMVLLEALFAVFQHGSPYCHKQNELLGREYRNRSLSVGDIVVVNGEHWAVDSFGFRKVQVAA